MKTGSRVLGDRGGEPLELVLYTRARCPLCDAMKSEIARAGLGSRCVVRGVDIDTDPVLRERFGRSIPVLEIAGRVAFEGRLVAADLARAVERALHEREPAREG